MREEDRRQTDREGERDQNLVVRGKSRKFESDLITT